MSSSVISVPANKRIRINNADDNPEINAIAITPMNDDKINDNQNQLNKNCEDVCSIKGIFYWKIIEKYKIPCIIRLINGKRILFVSVKMAEIQLLSNYIHYLKADILACTSIRGHFITDHEAKLLNDINQNHVDCMYGNEMFVAGKDYIVYLKDVHKFYTFIKVCYETLWCNIQTGRKEKCGFIICNPRLAVPYCIIDNQKFVPLLFFEGETDSLIRQAVKLENWNLAYLKLCFVVQGLKNEYLNIDSCLVTSVDVIKSYYPTDTYFEDYWPSNNKFLAFFQNNKYPTHVNPSGAWIIKPPRVVPAENNIPRALIPSIPVQPHNIHIMPVMINTYQNEQLANQMGSALLKGSSLGNITSHVIPPPPPPLAIVNNTAQVIGNDISYPNIIPVTQCQTIRYNPITDDNNTKLQLFSQQAIHNCHNQQPQMPQKKKKTTITATQTQQSCSSQSVRGRTNSKVLNASGNVDPILIAPANESIDLTSPPSSTVPSSVQEASIRPKFGLKLLKIPERRTDRNHAVYKIQKKIFKGKMICCINAKPYNHTYLLVTLEDIVQILSASIKVARCAYILQKYLKTTLFVGNSEQLAMLRQNGCNIPIHSKHTPMVILQDIMVVWKKLKILLNQNKQNI